MAEYVERDKLPQKIGYWDNYSNGWNDCLDAIAKIHAADVRPVVRGKWTRIYYKPLGHDYKCSDCGWKNDMQTHFCPNCGEKMEES